MEAQHQKWFSIGALHQVAATFHHEAETYGTPLPTVEYQAKVKLHGMNAGIQVLPDGRVLAQSRHHIVDSGFEGFPAFVAQTQDRWRRWLRTAEPVIVFGEWCGPGVQKGMAVSQLERKIFAIFALQVGYGEEAEVFVDPVLLRKMLPEHPDVFVLPWYREGAVTLDFAASNEAEMGDINALILAVEKEDPWIVGTFGVSGLGKGLVYYPHEKHHTTAPRRLGRTMWKAKGERHKTVNQKTRVQMAPEVVASAVAYAELMLPEGRLRQAVTEACDGTPSQQRTGDFMRWIVCDVEKEGQAELAAAGLEWRQVKGPVSKYARAWFGAQCATYREG